MITESAIREVTRLLQTHVRSMIARVKEGDRFIGAIRCLRSCSGTQSASKRATSPQLVACM